MDDKQEYLYLPELVCHHDSDSDDDDSDDEPDTKEDFSNEESDIDKKECETESDVGYLSNAHSINKNHLTTTEL